MITIVSPPGSLTTENVIGKYILLKSNTLLTELSDARKVLAIEDGKLVTEEARVVCYDASVGYVSRGAAQDGSQPEPRLERLGFLKRVHVVCDTIAEVAILRNLSLANEQAMRQIKENSFARLKNLDGHSA